MCITPKDTHGSGDEKVRLAKEGVSRMLSPQYVEAQHSQQHDLLFLAKLRSGSGQD